MMTDELEFLGAIADRVNEIKPHLRAEVWNSGGHIYGVMAWRSDGLSTFWGTANDEWGADVDDGHGEVAGYMDSDVPTDSTDVERIAQAIATMAEGEYTR